MSLMGVTSSIANDLGGAVGSFLKNPLTRSFFLYYYLPAAGFLLLHGFLILPAVGQPPLDVSQFKFQPSEAALSGDLMALVVDFVVSFLSLNVVLLLLLPLAIGALTGNLSLAITKLFEGLLPFERPLLRRWLERNRKKSEELYGPLKAKRREYLRTAIDQGADSDEAITLAGEIQALHESIEAKNSDEILPKDSKRVTPTALGNVLAVAEEYPFDRYGIDAVLFWPRVRAEAPPEQLVGLDETKGALDGLLNVTLLAYLFALEALVLGVARIFVRIGDGPGPSPALLIGSALAAMAVGWMSYRAAVSAAKGMGRLLQTLFDYYRGAVLEKFGLSLPGSLEKEKQTWLRLAAFLRRGEPFYFPKKE